MKRCSTSLIIREMQIKTTMRYHLTPVRMVIISKPTNRWAQTRMGRKGSPFALLVETQTGAATVESSIGVSSKNEKQVCLLSGWSHFENISKETQNNSKDTFCSYWLTCEKWTPTLSKALKLWTTWWALKQSPPRNKINNGYLWITCTSSIMAKKWTIQ